MVSAHAFKNEPRLLDNRWCSECGEQTCAQCDCGVKFVGKGKFADIAVQKHPRMSGHDLANKYPGISRKTFDRAKERIGTSGPMTTQTSDGREYPTNRKRPDLKLVGPENVSRPESPSQLSPTEADAAIITMARYLDTSVFDPPRSARISIKDAMCRAAPAQIAIIRNAALFLCELMDAKK